VQVTIAQLQHLATALAEGSLNELALSGQTFAGLPTAEKFRIRDKIIDQLTYINVPPVDRLASQRLWITVNCSLILGQIEGFVVKAKPNVDLKSELAPLQRDDKHGNLPTPASLRKWIVVATGSKADELLQEYETVWTTGSMKRPELIPFGSIPVVQGIDQLPVQSADAGGAYNNGGILAVSPPPH
jgi:hypothetical protein